jgi:Protein of unknown function (DUF3604)
MKQIKGQSETHPLLSPNDEFANYETMSFLIGLPEDSGRVPHIVGSYARQALRDGLTMQDTRGYNPYKFGVVGGSDSHNTGAPYRQNNFYGGHGINDGTIETRMSGHIFTSMDVRYENPSGLTGIWAEENTRASLWDAMYRKETFGTSGPRIRIRFFGGWDYAKDLTNQKTWVKTGYAKGVPMGADLPPAKGKSPTFVVWAVKDPTSGNLDRIQIVKGWTKHGQSFEKIYDVVWSGNRKPDKWTGKVLPIESTVDIDNATYSNDVGATELRTVWTDPDFDPSLHAFYYARALEIPTPRWWRRRTSCRPSSRNVPGARPSGTRRPPRPARGRPLASQWQASPTREPGPPDRRPAEEAHRRQVHLGTQQRHRRADQDPLRRRRKRRSAPRGKECDVAEPDRGPSARELPDHCIALHDQRREDRDAAGQYADQHGRLPVRRQGTTAPAATSSVTPTTRSCSRARRTW